MTQLFKFEVEPAVRIGRALRPAVQIAGDMCKARIGQQVDGAAVRLSFDAFINGTHQTFQAGESVALGKTANFGLDSGFDLLLHVRSSR